MPARPIGDRFPDGRVIASSAERNKGPILDVLARVLPARGVVLEIASGSGQHVVHFAKALPKLAWQPSDPETGCRASIRRWVEHEALANVRPPIALDVDERPWPVASADAIVCINMIHVAPWSATRALFEGARDVLRAGGTLVLYGPYRRGGRHTAPSNETFDASLRAHDPRWGLRDVDDVIAVAERADFGCNEIVAMPANNLTIVFRRRSSAQ